METQDRSPFHANHATAFLSSDDGWYVLSVGVSSRLYTYENHLFNPRPRLTGFVASDLHTLTFDDDDDEKASLAGCSRRR